MKKNQTSRRGGIQDFLCPFTDMYITQGSGGEYSHKGTMANDVRGLEVGVKYLYYAPVDVKCLKTYPESGQVMWQSLEAVRFSNGNIDVATFMTAHDNTMDAYIGQVVRQGEQLGNMGDKGNATGVHCHIEIEQGADTSWYKNEYGIYHFNNEVDTDDCYFCDDTNIMNCYSANWKYLKDVEVEEKPVDNPIYECLGDMYVRWGASYNAGIKLVKDLTEDGKKNATSSNPDSLAAYKKGTRFTCYEIVNIGKGDWAITPSGYVCIKGESGTVYCKEVK